MEKKIVLTPEEEAAVDEKALEWCAKQGYQGTRETKGTKPSVKKSK